MSGGAAAEWARVVAGKTGKDRVRSIIPPGLTGLGGSIAGLGRLSATYRGIQWPPKVSHKIFS